MGRGGHAVCFLLLCVFLLIGASAARPRVRKELRSLSEAEYRALIVGLSTLATVPTESGRLLFGGMYLSYSEMLMKHAVAVNDPRGDQGHTGPCFMTFHRAFLLELEQALLAVQPALRALPYWDVTLDAPGGKYHGTPNYIFSKKYAGKLDGDAKAGYGVTSGIFGWRQIPKFIAAQWPQYSSVFSGSASGYVRSAGNTNQNPLVTRYPVDSLLDALDANAAGESTTFLPFGTLPRSSFAADYLQKSTTAGYSINYPPALFRRCLDPKKYRTWMEWSFCIDLAVLSDAPPSMTAAQKLKYVGPGPKTTALFHVGPHWAVGSVANDTAANGDMYDVATSPHEMLLFFAHHANVDRSSMTWQAAAARANASLVAASWGYPATTAQYPTAKPGCLLGDVLNARGPYARLFLPQRRPANATGYTHRELLHHTRPGASPYVYDSMR